MEDLEYDYREEEGEPDIEGALEYLRKAKGNCECIEKAIELLSPKICKVYSPRMYHHRGYWTAPDITIHVNGFELYPEKMWAYDCKDKYENIGSDNSGLLRGTYWSDGNIDVWGRLIIRSDEVSYFIDQVDDRARPFHIVTGNSEFMNCMMHGFILEDGIGKLDWVALKAKNFGYNI